MNKKLSARLVAFKVAHEFLALVGLGVAGVISLAIADWGCWELRRKIGKWSDQKLNNFAKVVADEVLIVNGRPASYCTEEESGPDQEDQNTGQSTTGEGDQPEGSPGADLKEGEQ